MELKKIALLLHQINTHLLPIMAGVLLTIGVYQILPSQANIATATAVRTFSA